MKKKLMTLLISTLTVLMMLFAFVGCADPALKEVAGTYEMTSVSGTVNGVTIKESLYEYFRLILEENGKGTVQSKAAGVGGAAYEASGKYTYKDGKITLTTSNGFASVSEEYDYADGVITYTVENEQMNFTLVLTRVNQEEEAE